MKKDIYVFICESEEVGRAIIKGYFEKDKITYASLFSADKRDLIVKKLEEVEELDEIQEDMII